MPQLKPHENGLIFLTKPAQSAFEGLDLLNSRIVIRQNSGPFVT